MIAAVNVTTAATLIIPANVKRLGFIIQNTSDADVFLKLDSSATVLTAGNGLKLAPNEYFSLSTEENQLFDNVYAIHADVGNKEVRVQEFDKV